MLICSGGPPFAKGCRFCAGAPMGADWLATGGNGPSRTGAGCVVRGLRSDAAISLETGRLCVVDTPFETGRDRSGKFEFWRNVDGLSAGAPSIPAPRMLAARRLEFVAMRTASECNVAT